MVVKAVADRLANAELSAHGVAANVGGVHQVVGAQVVRAVRFADVVLEALGGGVIGKQQLAAILWGVPSICADLGSTVIAGDIHAVIAAATAQQDRVTARAEDR